MLSLLRDHGPDEQLDAGVPARLAGMLRRGALEPPLPGQGRTADRWSALAGWGRQDLALARLAEGHADAVAILAEAGRRPAPGALYGVWAARTGGTGAMLADTPDGPVVRGRVRFCSGAHLVHRALVVARPEDAVEGPTQLFDLGIDDHRVRCCDGSWQADGMRASDTSDIEFDDLPADEGAPVGPPGFYTERPGFWWGGAGVASVWLGGAAGLVSLAHRSLAEPDPHQLVHLGTLHTTLAAADALLTATAVEIDAVPGRPHRTRVRTARAAVEASCRLVLDLVPRLVGVAALSGQRRLSRQLADLAIYLRQHHGERDLAELGHQVYLGGCPR